MTRALARASSATSFAADFGESPLSYCIVPIRMRDDYSRSCARTLTSRVYAAVWLLGMKVQDEAFRTESVSGGDFSDDSIGEGCELHLAPSSEPVG
jgi:hypothetical protein